MKKLGFPEIPVFVIEKDKKSQAKKVLEEASEFLEAMKNYEKDNTSENRKRVLEEGSDVYQALMNAFEMILASNATLEEEAMNCFARNHARGRFEDYEKKLKEKEKINLGKLGDVCARTFF